MNKSGSGSAYLYIMKTDVSLFQTSRILWQSSGMSHHVFLVSVEFDTWPPS